MNRIQKLQKRLSVDALIVEDLSDLLYLTGVAVSVGRLVVYPDRACFFVDGRYFEKAQNGAPCPVEMKEKIQHFLKDAKSVGFDSAFVTCEGFQTLKETFPDKEWVPLPKPLKELRLIKDPGEIDALRRAARLTWDGYRHIAALLKEGVTEEELAFEFEFFCRKRGASKLSFQSIVAFGLHSAQPHYRAGKAKLKPDQIVLFDLGAVVDNYFGDMTRVVFFGRPDPQLERDYHLIQRAQALAIGAVRPGAMFGELDRIVREELRKEEVESLFVHSLGHGIGLEAHECPSIRQDSKDANLRIEPGMVFTIEPGLYRPGIGGVRYEDTMVATATGVENFFAPLK